MASLSTTRPTRPSRPFLSTLFLLQLTLQNSSTSAQSSLCRTTCGEIPINYPFAIDDGCGSPYYRKILFCSNSSLHFRTPSGTYPVQKISYTDPHIVISDPSMWNCQDTGAFFRPAKPFSLDTSTHFSLSPKNDYLFFNCNPEAVIVQPKPSFCERSPDRCESACDSAGYLCRNLPGCPDAIKRVASCCSYFPKASASLRLMLKYCASYTSIYWRMVGPNYPPYDQVPGYGIRVDFEIPVTTRCLRCQDIGGGGGMCGFDTESRDFLCLCGEGNATTTCADDNGAAGNKNSARLIVGTTTAVSIAGLASAGALVWYLRKLRTNKVVTCGVQSNENRMF